MKHPLLSNTRYLALYGLFWLLFSVAHALINWNYYNMPLVQAVVNSLVQYLLFAILALNVWYVVKYNTFESNSWLRLIVFHFVAATIFILFWLFAYSFLIGLVFPEMKDMLTLSIPSRLFTGYLLYGFYLFFFVAIIYYQNFREKVKREAELKSLVREAELHALKSQINPHFLFNSLNSISSLTISDPPRAQEMIINLSALMRYSLKHGQDEMVTFGTELENNKLYLSIEKLRFGNKLQPLFQVDETCYSASIPNMILQPIYENAIKYGVYEATEPVEILTEASCTGNMLEITVTNPFDANVRSKRGEGIGLQNIRKRMEIIYGNSKLLKIKSYQGQFSITLFMPQIRHE